MAYQITFTKRFEKHFKDLNAQEKKQLQNKLCKFVPNSISFSAVLSVIIFKTDPLTFILFF